MTMKGIYVVMTYFLFVNEREIYVGDKLGRKITMHTTQMCIDNGVIKYFSESH